MEMSQKSRGAQGMKHEVKRCNEKTSRVSIKEKCSHSHKTDRSESVEETSQDCKVGKTGSVSQKHRKIISKCVHTSEQYYANGMCKNCYHAKGRTKLATKCEHHDRALYAKGVCKNCYLSIYHKKKRSSKKI